MEEANPYIKEQMDNAVTVTEDDNIIDKIYMYKLNDEIELQLIGLEIDPAYEVLYEEEGLYSDGNTAIIKDSLREALEHDVDVSVNDLKYYSISYSPTVNLIVKNVVGELYKIPISMRTDNDLLGKYQLLLNIYNSVQKSEYIEDFKSLSINNSITVYVNPKEGLKKGSVTFDKNLYVEYENGQKIDTIPKNNNAALNNFVDHIQFFNQKSDVANKNKNNKLQNWYKTKITEIKKNLENDVVYIGIDVANKTTYVPFKINRNNGLENIISDIDFKTPKCRKNLYVCRKDRIALENAQGRKSKKIFMTNKPNSEYESDIMLALFVQDCTDIKILGTDISSQWVLGVE